MKPTSVSPSKGKTKESTSWHASWWDFYPLAEQPLRPLQWSHSSVIFSAHPTQPLITGRHFSSSKQFIIPSPIPVSNTPSVYSPPTIISLASGEDWLFAYFPKLNGDGIGCLWKRDTQVDNWTIQEWWLFPRQTAPVATAWLGSPREWTIDNSGRPERLPPRGFLLPTPCPTLILVTQDYRVHICYHQSHFSNLQILKCPLGSTIMMKMNQQVPGDDPSDLVKLCMTASIGVSYAADFPLLIAARIRQSTVPTTHNRPFDPMDLTVPVNTEQNAERAQDEWDSRNDDYVVELNQVYLRSDGFAMAIFVNPLPPIPLTNPGLIRMDFLSYFGNINPEDTGSKSPAKRQIPDRGKIYLALTFLDFDGYISPPKSHITIYSIGRRIPLPNKQVFVHQLEATRSFTTGVLTSILSSSPHAKHGILPVVILDVSGPLGNATSQKVKDIAVGKVYMLRLPALTDCEDWEPTSIKMPLDAIGKDMPLQAVSSPNGVLLYTTSLSLVQPYTGVHLLPVPDHIKTDSVPPLTNALIIAIKSRSSTSDICHYLSLPSISLPVVVDILSTTMRVLDANNNGLKNASTRDVLGVSVEVYRKRAEQSKEEAIKNNLTAKWQTAHEMCSVAACNIIFGDCTNGEGYVLEAAWQLTGLSNWIINLTERIMKECVLFVDTPPKMKTEEMQDDLFGPGFEEQSNEPEYEISPTLLHLVHPFAIYNLTKALKHVGKYYSYLRSLSVQHGHAQIARDFLVDLVDCCGVKLTELEAFLETKVKSADALNVEECRIALASCQPTPALQGLLTDIIKGITSDSTIINKTSLFIKPSDLVDGIASLSLGLPKKYQDEDIITKSIVKTQEPHLTCSRCGGSSNVVFDIQSSEPVSQQWITWEKMWSMRCICGGSWVGGN